MEQIDYRETPNFGSHPDPEGCPSYDNPIVSPEQHVAPQPNGMDDPQDRDEPYNSMALGRPADVQGTSPGAAEALAWERRNNP